MKTKFLIHQLTIIFLSTQVFFGIPVAYASGGGYSIVPYLGLSRVGDQSPDFADADAIADGRSDVSVDQGFTAGLGIRYDYPGSRWISEFGWEYRSNDSVITSADGTSLPSGNYASNTFYINGRYTLGQGNRLTPWIGGGVMWIQEIDLDSEFADGERSFSDSGSIGTQVMAGADYDITERFFLSGELRYSRHTKLKLDEEGGGGLVVGIDYQPLTIGIGLGYRF